MRTLCDIIWPRKWRNLSPQTLMYWRVGCLFGIINLNVPPRMLIMPWNGRTLCCPLRWVRHLARRNGLVWHRCTSPPNMLHTIMARDLTILLDINLEWAIEESLLFWNKNFHFSSYIITEFWLNALQEHFWLHHNIGKKKEEKKTVCLP